MKDSSTLDFDSIYYEIQLDHPHCHSCLKSFGHEKLNRVYFAEYCPDCYPRIYEQNKLIDNDNYNTYKEMYFKECLNEN